jgi:hypothetical protein
MPGIKTLTAESIATAIPASVRRANPNAANRRQPSRWPTSESWLPAASTAPTAANAAINHLTFARISVIAASLAFLRLVIALRSLGWLDPPARSASISDRTESGI